MKVIYRLQIACACPVDDLGDVYDVVIEAERIIRAEDIMVLAGDARYLKVYQEDLCRTWARELRAKVTMTGWHGCVFTEVTCG